jgi:hypothetical protein
VKAFAGATGKSGAKLDPYKAFARQLRITLIIGVFAWCFALDQQAPLVL